MSNFVEKLTNRWPDVANFLLGLWLVASPWVLGYAGETTAAWNVYIFGAAIAVLAAIAFFAQQKWEHWVSLAIGAWLIVSPWVLAYVALQAALWNQIVIGLVVCVLAIWAAASESGFGGLAARS